MDCDEAEAAAAVTAAGGIVHLMSPFAKYTRELPSGGATYNKRPKYYLGRNLSYQVVAALLHSA